MSSQFWSHPWPVTTVVTHERAHLDELASIVALQRGGTRLFPGVQDLSASDLIPFVPSQHLDDRDEEEWLEEENTLFIGVRGGRFDDHPHEQFPDRCTLTLVLAHLGLLEDCAWSRINAEVLREDRRGTNVDFHLARLIKHTARFSSLDEALGMVDLALGGYLAAQASYQEALALVRDAPTVMVRNKSFQGAQLTICWIDGCDNEDFARAARSRRDDGGLEAAIVIQRNSAGNVYISSNHFLGVMDLSHLAGKLRHEEQVHRVGYCTEPEGKLRGDGDGYCWYHQKQAASLFNGSMCYRYVEPTKLSLDTIVDAAKHHLAYLTLTPKSKGAIDRLKSLR